MTNMPQSSDAITRARMILDQYSRRNITEPSLVGAIADLVTSENVDEVMGLIPTTLLPLFIQWIEGFRVAEASPFVLWPLPPQTVQAFNEWLTQRELRHSA